MIRTLHRFFPLLTLVLFVSSCKKTEEVKQEISPIKLETTAVGSVTDEAVTLRGTLHSLNSENITDIGFILYESIYEEVNPKEISIGSSNVKEGEISFIYKPESKFKPLTYYSYCIYIKTDKSFYKGELVPFQIDNINIVEKDMEKSGLGDIVYVEGDFDRIGEDFRVVAGQRTILPHTLSADSHTLTITLPKQGYVHGDELDIELQYNPQNGLYKRRFLRKVKIVATFEEPTRSAYGLFEPVTLIGYGVPSFYTQDLFLLIGNERVPFSQTFYMAHLPTLAQSYKWGYYNGKDSVFFKSQLSLKAPLTDEGSFSQPRVHTGETLYLYNIDLYSLFNNTVTKLALGQHEVERKLPHANELYFSIKGVPDGTYPLTIYSPYYSYNTSKKLQVQTLRWNSIDLKEAYYDDVLTLSGTFIKDHGYTVEFIGDNKQLYLTSNADGELKFPVPLLNLGDHKIKVSYGLDYEGNVSYVDTQKDLTILKPTIDEMSPTSGYPGDIITIRGKGLKKMNQLSINGNSVYPMHQENGDILFFIPSFIPAGKAVLSADFDRFLVIAPNSLEIK